VQVSFAQCHVGFGLRDTLVCPMDSGSCRRQLCGDFRSVDAGENIPFLNDSALVDTDFGKAASVLGRHIDAFYLDATIGAR